MKITNIREKSLITAIKTPFNQRGRIDLPTFDKLVEKQIEFGVEGLIVGGTTGEGHLLDWEEHLMLIAHTASRFGDQLLVVGNTGSNNTRESVKASKHAFAMGMHAALLINPYYGKTSSLGVRKHIEAALDIGPAFIYNVPGRTGQDIDTDTMINLSQHDHFIGVKECAGNERIAEYEAQGIACWSGNDDECFEARHLHGAHGVISVTSNIAPNLMRRLMDDNSQTFLNQSLQPLFSWLFSEPNPIAINTALAMTGAIEPIFRLPYVPLNKESRILGLKLLKAIETSEIVGDIVGHSLKLLKDQDFRILV
ncbi:MAG: 4-hydroxy-tetrahydrodipicolinate synthase [Kangiellaceae bacterium]|nr:4-hydroxy-tetrahydrodipicolinate synthase [Kangiellaceae bacterium]